MANPRVSALPGYVLYSKKKAKRRKHEQQGLAHLKVARPQFIDKVMGNEPITVQGTKHLTEAQLEATSLYRERLRLAKVWEDVIAATPPPPKG